MKIILTLAALFVQATLFGQHLPDPPVCKKVPKTDTIHGKILTDNYAWLKERDNPDVLAYLKAENAYTKKIMKPTDKLQKKLYEEIVARIKQTDVSVPYKLRGYWYYTTTEEGKNYYVSCRKKDSMDNAEEVLIDVNEFVEKYDYYGVYYQKISPDNRMMATFVDKNGNFETDILFKDLQTGLFLNDTLRAVTSLTWANDNKTIFYSIQDSITNRSYKVYRHILGQPVSNDHLIFHEKDSLYDVYLAKSKSEQFIFLSSSSAEQSETWFVNANSADDKFKVIHPREEGHIYDVSHYKDKFYILTDKDAINFRLVGTDTAAPSIDNWKEIIPHRDNVMLTNIDIFKEYLVVNETEQGRYKVRIIHWQTRQEQYIPFEEEVYTAYSSYNPDFDTDQLRYTYYSLRIPYSVYEFNMKSGESKLLKQKEVLGGYDPANYVSERLWATAHDGKKVPISVVYKKGLQKNGNNPLYIDGYGAYGSSSFPNFSSSRLNLLDRGFVVAIAHVRGGSDLGRAWYEDGKLLHKKNTITDFIACVEHLINEKYTAKGMVVAEGVSAGGLLAGALANTRPDLFKGVILDVPFVDVINTMLDPNMPLTTQEYEEWGNPNDKEYFDYIYSYSPYDNVKKQDYPSMLFMTGLTDEQVSYWEPTKMVAKLRDMKTDENKLLLKVELASGHGGVSGRYNQYKEIAFVHAFILSLFDLPKPAN